jgi:hypothetical protein
LLPLLARWEGVKEVTLLSKGASAHNPQLTPDAVGALGALLEGMPSCTKLNLYGCTPNPSALLLPALTHTSVGVLHLDVAPAAACEAQIMQWCAGSQPGRPFTVKVWGSGEVYCTAVANVRAALAQAGSAVDLVTG